MRISDETIKKVLVRSGVATEEQIQALTEEAAKLDVSIQELALQRGTIDDIALAKAFSKSL